MSSGGLMVPFIDSSVELTSIGVSELSILYEIILKSSIFADFPKDISYSNGISVPVESISKVKYPVEVGTNTLFFIFSFSSKFNTNSSEKLFVSVIFVYLYLNFSIYLNLF